MRDMPVSTAKVTTKVPRVAMARPAGVSTVTVLATTGATTVPRSRTPSTPPVPVPPHVVVVPTVRLAVKQIRSKVDPFSGFLCLKEQKKS